EDCAGTDLRGCLAAEESPRFEDLAELRQCIAAGNLRVRLVQRAPFASLQVAIFLAEQQLLQALPESTATTAFLQQCERGLPHRPILVEQRALDCVDRGRGRQQ